MGKKKDRAAKEIVPELSGHAKLLSEIGPATAAVTIQLNSYFPHIPLLKKNVKESPFQILSEAFKDWDDEETACVLTAIASRLQKTAPIDYIALKRWVLAHKNDARAVVDCLEADPPEEITIIRLLSRAGSQKLVFLANWQIAQKEVVLKRFIAQENAECLISRELQPHPLSMAHPNIIETHLLKNVKGESFLVERRLPFVLDDEWRSKGIEEAANLLRDIASALAFIQEKRLVHGDVKPDNIGFEDGRYILLDFGICRSEDAFAETSTATGSLRTRAPELLLGEQKHSHATDLWALGATVYNAVTGRFPLLNLDEKPPRTSHGKERSLFELKLAERVKKEWSGRVNLSIVAEPLRPILGKILSANSMDRGKAEDLVGVCEAQLAAFLRESKNDASRFSPTKQLEQLTHYLPDETILRLMPSSQKHELTKIVNSLQSLKNVRGLSKAQLDSIDELPTEASIGK
jgi:serine/threonine protein kinase